MTGAESSAYASTVISAGNNVICIRLTHGEAALRKQSKNVWHMGSAGSYTLSANKEPTCLVMQSNLNSGESHDILANTKLTAN